MRKFMHVCVSERACFQHLLNVTLNQQFLCAIRNANFLFNEFRFIYTSFSLFFSQYTRCLHFTSLDCLVPQNKLQNDFMSWKFSNKRLTFGWMRFGSTCKRTGEPMLMVYTHSSIIGARAGSAVTLLLCIFVCM